jgi:hypothetical protein
MGFFLLFFFFFFFWGFPFKLGFLVFGCISKSKPWKNIAESSKNCMQLAVQGTVAETKEKGSNFFEVARSNGSFVRGMGFPEWERYFLMHWSI